jgi:hypothetical protein
MTSSAKPTGNAPAPIAAVALKLVGTITILAALVDFLVLLIPPNFLERQWQIATTTQLVDRGIVPLVGIALLFTGSWMESYLGSTAARKRPNLLLDGRFWTCVLSSVLGLMFLVLTFIHPNNVRLQSQEALNQVSEQATQANSQLEQRLSQEVTQQRSQIDTLLANQELLNQAVASGQVSQEQAAQLEQFRADPNALDTFLNQQATQLKSQLQTEIGSRREQATKQVQTEALKASIRISLSSILLAIGYTIIGWTGLKRLLTLSS